MIDFTSRSWLFHLTFWSWLFFDFLLIKCWLLADFFWLFFTSRSHEKVRWCLLKVTESQKKSKKSSRKSQKYDMFFWHNLTSFAIFSKNEKKLQVQNVFNFYHRWHTVITRRHYKWSWLRIWTHDIFSIFWNFF